jgi:hypothetical protein
MAASSPEARSTMRHLAWACAGDGPTLSLMWLADSGLGQGDTRAGRRSRLALGDPTQTVMK